jgi:predicted Fe-Mo cluster-binding NifX family protein
MVRIAVPTTDGQLSLHFGKAKEFILIDVNPDSRKVHSCRSIYPPPHGPGVIPQWLRTFDVNVIIAGGMGPRAIQMFEPAGIKVVLGATGGSAEDLVADYLSDELELGPDPCDHGIGHSCHDEGGSE